ncbi:hypothetical protein RI367_002321 [Sorochytrium milnesiophthora]
MTAAATTVKRRHVSSAANKQSKQHQGNGDAPKLAAVAQEPATTGAIALNLALLFSFLFIVVVVLMLVRFPWRHLVIVQLFLFVPAMTLLAVCLRQSQGPQKRSKSVRVSPAVLKSLLVVNMLLFIPAMDLGLNVLLWPHHDATIYRLGGITPTFASVFVRNPAVHTLTLTLTTAASNDTVMRLITPVNDTTDYTHTFRMDNLTPATEYRFAITDEQGRAMTTNGTFKTFPAAGQAVSDDTPLRFAYGSCTAFTPYRMGIYGYQYIAERNPEFFVHLGDFVYADHPYIVGDNTERYRRLYRRVLKDPYYRNLSATVPMYFMSDDHEIIDNWDRKLAAPYTAAMGVWQEYSHNSDPVTFPNDPAPEASTIAEPYPVPYYNYTHGNTAFFVTNSRVYRDLDFGSDAPEANKTHLGTVQLQRLKTWLLDTNATFTWKFVFSSVPIALNYQDSDTWFGFQRERLHLLSFIRDNNIRNVHFLTGDRHEAGIFRLNDLPPFTNNVPGYISGADSATGLVYPDMYDFSASPIHAFYDDWASVVDRERGVVFYEAQAQNWFGLMEVYAEHFDMSLIRNGKERIKVRVDRV